MKKQDFINQWNEVKTITSGMTADEIRTYFADNVIRELEEGVGLDHNLIDINYKNILVTFIVKGNTAKLHDYVETYDNDGNFVGVMIMKNNQCHSILSMFYD